MLLSQLRHRNIFPFFFFNFSLALQFILFLFFFLSLDGAGNQRPAADFPRRRPENRRRRLRWAGGHAALGLLRRNRRRSEADSGVGHRNDLRRLLQFRRISSQITRRSHQRLCRVASEQSRRRFQFGSAQGSSLSYLFSFASFTASENWTCLKC